MRSPVVHIAVLSALLLTLAAADHAVEIDILDEEQFSRQERRWTARWTNRSLEALMAHGIIESITGADRNFRVQTGDAWLELSFRQAGEILQNLSRAREISGHSPFFSVEHVTSGAVIGRVAEDAITLLLPGEGLFEYLPDTAERENTVY